MKLGRNSNMNHHSPGEDDMKEGKYIVFKDGSARVFKKHHVHVWMADGKPARSAGYYRKENGEVECYGESGTLGIKAHEDDAEIIEPYL